MLAVGEVAEAVFANAQALDVVLILHSLHQVLAALAIDELAVHIVIAVKEEGQVGDVEHGVKVAPNAVGLERHIDGAVHTGLHRVRRTAVGQLVGAVDVQLHSAVGLLLQQLAELLQTDVKVGALGAGGSGGPCHLGEAGIAVAAAVAVRSRGFAAITAGNEAQRHDKRQNEGQKSFRFHR